MSAALPRRYPPHVLLAVAITVVSASAARAAEQPTRAEEKPTLRASTVSAEAAHELRLDGRLTEPAWAAADSISNLITIEPEEGGTPAGGTTVRVLAHPDEILVGVQCFDPDPSGIVSYSKARDSVLDEEDHVMMVFDTFGDERSGYVFAVNPGGARFDGLVTAQGDEVNANWDAVWEAATAHDATGWSAEIRIPIKSLSFEKGLAEWGFNVQRRLQRLQETSRWWGANRDFEIYQTSQAGLLAGLPEFDLGLGLTVRPALVATVRRTEPGVTRHLLRDADHELSLDVTQKLGPNLSATATVNTDFGETEADVRQTNLGRFGLLFPERRAFFLDGADIFEFGFGLDVEDATIVPFFSRRIGIHVPEGEDEESGVSVPIRAGGKLQGRIGETNLGGLVVGTDEVDELGVPRATVGAFRIRQNVLSESSVGVIGTFGDPLDRSDSWLGGVDLTLRTSEFRDEKNLVAGIWGLKTQRDGLEGDRRAFGGKIAYPNDELDIGVAYQHVGEGFDPSLSFVQRRGQVVDADVEINHRPKWELLRQQTYGAAYFLALDPDGEWESYAWNFRPLEWLFESGDRIETTIEPQGEQTFESFDVFDSPAKTIEIPAGIYRWTRYSVGGALAEKRRISGNAVWSFGGFYEGDLHSIEASVLLKPASVLTFQLGGERNLAKLPEGDFTQYLYTTRVELKVSPDFQVTSFLQYDNESRSMGSATRLRWTFSPLGDLFLAFDHNMLRSLETGRRNRWEFASDQQLVKIQYAIRL